MNDLDHLVEGIAAYAEASGLTGNMPEVLSPGGNLIVHLAPYPIVARAAVVASMENAANAYAIQMRELQVAHHLHRQGIPVILPAESVHPGPHLISKNWVTFWPYLAPQEADRLPPERAAAMVAQLTQAMRSYQEPLPIMGVWDSVRAAAGRLRIHPDKRILLLTERYACIDRVLHGMDPAQLVPSHGDAHPGNLVPSGGGWIWIDFEDVSRMPPYWDMASYAANPTLFGGLEEPVYAEMLNRAQDQPAFKLALSARMLMSILSNLDLALRGHGDLEYAMQQLNRAEPILTELER